MVMRLAQRGYRWHKFPPGFEDHPLATKIPVKERDPTVPQH